jgi:hypothetical protein
MLAGISGSKIPQCRLFDGFRREKVSDAHGLFIRAPRGDHHPLDTGMEGGVVPAAASANAIFSI